MHPSSSIKPKETHAGLEDITPIQTEEPGAVKSVNPSSSTSKVLISHRTVGAANPENNARPPSAPRRPGRTVALFVIGVLVLAVSLLSIRYLLPKPVELMPVVPGLFQAEIRGAGTLNAINKANVSSSAQGVITALHVDRDDALRKGDVIAEVNADELKAQLSVSHASQEAARMTVEALNADRRRAEAILANARSTLARQAELQRSGTSTRSALESAQTAVEQAEADLSKARSSIQQAQAQETEAAARVTMNQAQLDKSVIVAPIDGLVVARDLNLGDVVSPGTAIVELVDASSIVLTARFDESAIALLSAGQDVTITFNSGGEAAIDGKVRRIGREVDTETREFTVDITPKRLPANWAIGQRALAVIDLEHKSDVISVPATAIVRHEGAPGVWTVVKGRAVWAPLELGAIGGKRVEVRSGLGKGEVVIVDPKRIYAYMPVARPEFRP